MVIQVSVREGRRTVFSPDPAIVSVHERVAWAFQLVTSEDVHLLEWTVYFEGLGPFKSAGGPQFISLRTTAISRGSHIGVLNAGPVQAPGEYKYGVRVSVPAAARPLSDDDPYLIVRP